MSQPSSPFYTICPLGGLGEIGSNMTIVQTAGQNIIIDIGILFPSNEAFELNYLIPDFHHLDARLCTHLIITHGHEDHIGAVAHLVKHMPHLEVWASPLAGALIQNKCQRQKVNVKVHLFDEDHIFSLKTHRYSSYRSESFIPETYGLLIQDKQKATSAFFISDFKYDDHSPYEKPFNFAKLKKLTQRCAVRLLMMDSTNAVNPGKTHSEGDLIPKIKESILGCHGRAYITFFASNLHRLQTILTIAHESGKKVAYLGRAMKNYGSIGARLGLLKHFKETLLPEEKIKNYKQELIVVVSGCQGDQRAALKRLADRQSPGLKLEKGDRVIFSSKTIPGNEKNITSILNTLAAQDVDVITAQDALIHASGHPGQEDLKVVLTRYNPTHFIPIHGETFLLRRHLQFVNQHFPEIKGFFMVNGNSAVVTRQKTIVIRQTQGHRPIVIHGKDIPIERYALSERAKLAGQGVLVVSINENPKVPALAANELKRAVKEAPLLINKPSRPQGPQRHQKGSQHHSQEVVHSIPGIQAHMFGLPQLLKQHKQQLDILLAQEIYKISKIADNEKKTEHLKNVCRKFTQHLLGYHPVIIIALN